MSSRLFHVFVSYNSNDVSLVEELARRLKSEGLEAWFDKWQLIPGESSQTALEQALADSGCVAVFLGSSGVGPWQNEEIRAAIARRTGQSDGNFRVIPVLLPGGTREERSRLPAFLLNSTWVEFRKSLDEEDAYHRLKSGILGLPPGLPPGRAVYEGQCPYRGLQAFQPEHASFFFGREGRIEWMLNALRATKGFDGAGTLRENRFLAIVGDSGSGKSSLARAGLVPALRNGKLEGSENWPIIIFRPGNDPLESLAVALTGDPKIGSRFDDVGDLITHMESDENRLHLATRVALGGADESQRIVLLIDQFEEVFTLHSDDVTSSRASRSFRDVSKISSTDSRRKAFINNLIYAAGIAGGKTIVVLTMRADFYSKCASYPQLAAAVTDHQELVGPMTEVELREVIERPARLVGLELERGLTEMLLHEIENQPGALPLLQHALQELWERREGRCLTIAAYKAIGGLEGALEQQANATFDAMSPAEQETCRRIFLRLTQPGEGSEDTKRRVPMSQLGDANVISPIINRLSNVRLITVEKDSFVEVSHEALIRSWSKLRTWIESERESMRTQHRLTEAAAEWSGSSRDSNYLYQGIRLAEAEEWSQFPESDLTQEEREFLSASLELRDRGKREEAERQAREIQTLTKLAESEKQRASEHAASARRLRWQSIGAMTLAAVALIAFGFAWKAQKEAQSAKTKVEDTYATSLLNRISNEPGPLERNEIDAFWQIASAQREHYGYGPRREYLIANALKEDNANRLINRAPQAARALIGLADKDRAVFIKSIKYLLNDSKSTESLKLAAVRIGVALNVTEKEFKEFANTALEILSKSMIGEENPRKLEALEEDLVLTIASMSEEESQQARAQIIDAMKRTKSAANLTALCDAINQITNKISQEDGRTIGDLLLRKMQDMVNQPREFVALQGCLNSLPEHVEIPTVMEGVKFIIQSMKIYPHDNMRESLCDLCRKGVKRLNIKDCETGANEFLNAMKLNQDSETSKYIARCLSITAVHCGQKNPILGGTLLLEGMRATDQADPIFELCQGLRNLQGTLTEQDGRTANDRLVELIRKESWPRSLSLLAKSLGENPIKIAEADLEQVKSKLLTVMKDYDTPSGMKHLAIGLKALPAPLLKRDSIAAFNRLLEMLKEANQDYSIQLLGSAMASVGGNLTVEAAEAAAELILIQMEATNDSRKIQVMASGIQGMETAVRSERIAAAYQIIQNKFKAPTLLPIDVANLVKSLAQLPGEIPENIADETIDIMLDVLLEKETDESVFGVDKLEIVCRDASVSLRQTAINKIIDKLDKTQETFLKQVLAHGLATICTTLKDDEFVAVDVPKVACRLITAMTETIDVVQMRSLAKAVEKTAVQLRAEKGQALCLNEIAPLMIRGNEPSDKTITYRLIKNIPDWIRATDDPTTIETLTRIWPSVADQMEPGQIDVAFKEILAAKSKAENQRARPALCEALVEFANAIDVKQAIRGLEYLLKGLQEDHDENELKILLEGVKAQAKRIPQNEAQKAKDLIQIRTEKQINEQIFLGLIESLDALPDALTKIEMVDLLKSPFCTAKPTKYLLTLLEKETGLKFGGDVWTLVKNAKAAGIGPDAFLSPARDPNNLEVFE